jgi:hypothetical protein
MRPEAVRTSFNSHSQSVSTSQPCARSVFSLFLSRRLFFVSFGRQYSIRDYSDSPALPTRSSTRSRWSITNEQNALQWKLKSPADVERLKKTFDFSKIVGITIGVPNSDRKMKNVVHHARLEDIFEKLIVVDGSTCLDLKDPPLTGSMSVSVETL